VTAGQNRDPKAPPARVRAIIQPKNKANQPAASDPRLDLKGAGGLGASAGKN
jgi:lipopolysaccharide export system protein LptA